MSERSATRSCHTRWQALSGDGGQRWARSSNPVARRMHAALVEKATTNLSAWMEHVPGEAAAATHAEEIGARLRRSDGVVLRVWECSATLSGLRTPEQFARCVLDELRSTQLRAASLLRWDVPFALYGGGRMRQASPSVAAAHPRSAGELCGCSGRRRRRCLGGCSAVRGELTSARHIRVGHACVLHVPRIDSAPLSRTMQRCGQRQVRRWGHRASPAGTAPPRSTRERGSTSLSETPRWHLSIRLATVTDWSAMLEDVRAYVVAVEASPSGRAAPDCGFGVRSLYNQVHIDWSLQDLPHAGFRPPPGTWNLEPRRNLYAS